MEISADIIAIVCKSTARSEQPIPECHLFFLNKISLSFASRVVPIMLLIIKGPAYLT